MTAMFGKGLEVFHLRKPRASKKSLEEYILRIPSRFRKKIVIHSHYELAKQYALKGIHVKDRSSSRKTALSKRFRENIVSAAVHTGSRSKPPVDGALYVFLSPVFKSISKRAYGNELSAPELKNLLAQFKTGKAKVLALGGIDETTLPKVQKAGFDGAASLGAIWQSSDPVKAFVKLKDLSGRS